MQPAEMDSPAREMQEMDEFVLVPHAADLWSYQLDEDDDAHESDARFFAGNDEKTIDVNHFASEPTPNAALQCATTEPPAPSGSDSESEDSVADEEEAVDGLSEKASDADEDGEVVVADQEPECKEWEGDHGHGWQQHAVGVICSVGLAAAATGLALLLGGQQQTPHKVHFRAAGDRKVTKVSARRDARLEQGMSVPRFEHAPAMISFGGSYGGHLF
ncbi:unnamed protein product [Triticum aestivum]|uniref:DUF6821 domain-containing protein n=3 Tax=Triticum aestivum TaxID=4565 RepID=A0A7H4LF56_WHEAT|nr:uncharacterized protein LOC123049098 [Triticum aestivum]SPT17244.1 unnamed protein product [Triticum aestivum]